MSDIEISEPAEAVLLAVHDAGEVDVYDLASAVGTGPRQVQERVRELDAAKLVVVSERGDRIVCTPAGDDYARQLQERR
jgi:Mn-dependent DtxR family transcriptional regulator